MFSCNYSFHVQTISKIQISQTFFCMHISRSSKPTFWLVEAISKCMSCYEFKYHKESIKKRFDRCVKSPKRNMRLIGPIDRLLRRLRTQKAHTPNRKKTRSGTESRNDMAEFPCQPESTNRRLQSILDLLSSAGYADAHKPDITAPEKLAGGLALCVAALNPPNSQIDVVVSSESLPHEDNKYATRFSLPLSLHLLSPSASMRRSSFPMTAYVCATMVGRKSKRL